MKYTFLLGLLACLFFAGCEDLEETYEDFSGDGPIRYLSKCKDVKVQSGWERLVVEWRNDLDPNRNGVWVRCQSDAVLRDTLLPADCDSCSFNNLADATYNVTVAAVSNSGDTSLLMTAAGRPYTYAHESVMGFPRGISKHIFLKDRLVIFLSVGTPEMLDFVLHYTGTDGSRKDYPLSFSSWDTSYEVLEDVDPEGEVVLSRKGLLEGCSDTITFEDYTLEKDLVNMAADFENALLERYGEVDLDRTELDLDYDLGDMTDLLYFQNLQTLRLGANRYYGGQYGNPTAELTQDQYSAIFAMQTLMEVNPDFKVLNYGEQYGLYGYPTCIEMLPLRTKEDLPEDLELLETTGFVVTHSVEGETGETELENNGYLLDDNDATVWEASINQNRRTHNLVIDMQEVKTVKGLKITQANVLTSGRSYKPSSISISVSVDGNTWTNPCHTVQNTLGTGDGEIKLLDFAAEQQVRYIRISVRDILYDEYNSCILGDVMPY